MTDFKPDIPILLEFRSMTRPINICVPTHVLRYLEAYAERTVHVGGAPRYRQGSRATLLPELPRRHSISAAC